MGKYDNYVNTANIERAQKRLNKLMRKRKPNPQKIAEAKQELENEQLFEHCQIFKSFNGRAPNENVRFNDDCRLIWFYGDVIPYDQLYAYSIKEKKIQKSYTKTKTKGALSRAIVGGMIAGELGAIVGAASADTITETKDYEIGQGFVIILQTKNGKTYSSHIENNGFINNKFHPKWYEVAEKLSSIMHQKI